MSHTTHHAILITTYSAPHAREAAEAAHTLAPFLPMCGPVESPVNGHHTLLICPDGSKEGWAASDRGDRERAALIAWLNDQRFEDGSNRYAWCEVAYGDLSEAEHGAEVQRSQWEAP